MLLTTAIPDTASERQGALESKASYETAYETAAIGTLKLLPSEDLRAQLAHDYSAMAEMFMSPPPSFNDMMASLSAPEAQLNGKT